MKKFCLFVVLFMSFNVISIAQKWERLADTPQMGWSTWNKFQGNIDEGIIISIADAMGSTGLKEAGYVYINTPECWHA